MIRDIALSGCFIVVISCNFVRCIMLNECFVVFMLDSVVRADSVGLI